MQEPFKNFFDLFRARRERRAEDVLTLNHGHHEIHINLTWTPHRVAVAWDDDGPVPVCVGNVDYISTEVVRDGFILYADINAATRRIRWSAHS